MKTKYYSGEQYRFRGVREWLPFGNLSNGTGNGGLSYLNGNNGLSNRNWNYLARISDHIYYLVLFILSADKIVKERRAGRLRTHGKHRKEYTHENIVQKYRYNQSCGYQTVDIELSDATSQTERFLPNACSV